VEAVNGQKLTVKGRTKIRFKLGGVGADGRKVRNKPTCPAFACVVSGLKGDVTLGVDILRLARVVLDFGRGELRHGLKQVALNLDCFEAQEGGLAGVETQAAVETAKDYTAEARQAVHVKIKADLKQLRIVPEYVRFCTLAEQEGSPVQHNGAYEANDFQGGGGVFAGCSGVVGFAEVPEVGPNRVEAKANKGTELPAWGEEGDPHNPALEAAAKKLFASADGREAEVPSAAPPARPPSTVKKKDGSAGGSVSRSKPTTWQEEVETSGVGAAEAPRCTDTPVNLTGPPTAAGQQRRFCGVLQQRRRTFASDDKPGFCGLARLHLDAGGAQAQ